MTFKEVFNIFKLDKNIIDLSEEQFKHDVVRCFIANNLNKNYKSIKYINEIQDQFGTFCSINNIKNVNSSDLMNFIALEI